MRLCFSVDQDGKITVKNIARTFASGKTEKLVYQCLGELGLPCEKVSVADGHLSWRWGQSHPEEMGSLMSVRGMRCIGMQQPRLLHGLLEVN